MPPSNSIKNIVWYCLICERCGRVSYAPASETMADAVVKAQRAHYGRPSAGTTRCESEPVILNDAELVSRRKGGPRG